MSDLKFVVNKLDGGITQPIGPSKVLEIAARNIRPRGPWWRMKERGDTEWGQRRTEWSDVRSHLVSRMQSAHIGDRIILDGQHGAYQMVVHAIDVAPPVKATEGNNWVDLIHTWVAKNYSGDWRSGGICVVKDIAGSSSPSQHNPWVHGGEHGEGGANAEDYFLRSMAEMVNMAERAVRERDPQTLPVGLAIVQQKIWTPSQGWHYYTGETHYHVHLEGWQESTGAIRSSC